MRVTATRTILPALALALLTSCGSAAHDKVAVPSLSTSTSTSASPHPSTSTTSGHATTGTGTQQPSGDKADDSSTGSPNQNRASTHAAGTGATGANGHSSNSTAGATAGPAGASGGSGGSARVSGGGSSHAASRSSGQSSTGHHGASSNGASAAAASRGRVAAVTSNGIAGSGAPIAIGIPALGLNRSITAIAPSGGVLSPPSWQVSWDAQTATPGAAGTSVILGHVTENGPDVFYSLHTLGVGSTVTLRQANGGTSTWRVSTKYTINKDTARTDSRIWRNSGTPMVALVTCDANSAWVGGGHHANNYVLLLTKV